MITYMDAQIEKHQESLAYKLAYIKISERLSYEALSKKIGISNATLYFFLQDPKNHHLNYKTHKLCKEYIEYYEGRYGTIAKAVE